MRFKVKRYIKELNTFDPTTKEGNLATDLLTELFKILSHGSVYLLFSNLETFRAVQIEQSDFLEMIIKRKLMFANTKETLEYCVNLLNVDYSPDESYSAILSIFEGCLINNDMKS